jgi:hypothetical protein
MGLEESIDRDDRAMERIASSFEVIADTLVAWYKLDQQRFDYEHPVKPVASDIDVHVPETEEERLRKLMSASDEEIAEYVGPRESEYIARPPERAKEPVSKPGNSKAGKTPKKARGKKV